MNVRLERQMAAVEVDGRRARLEVSYKISNPGQEESDSNAFSEIIGGRENLSEAQARRNCVESAIAWSRGMQAENWDIAVWDAQGNCY